MKMAEEPLHVIASTSGDADNHDHVNFQYSWPVKITQRLLENAEAAVLNVSPAFTTSYNGVQFTWALRLADECVVATFNDVFPSSRQVCLHLYFKDGPCSDIQVEEVRAHVMDQANNELIRDLVLEPREFTKGSGWPLSVGDCQKREHFSEIIQRRIDQQITIIVCIKMKTSLFEPIAYIPDGETSQRIEKHCLHFIKAVKERSVKIPNLELMDSELDRFAMHRLIFLYGCDLVEKDCLDEKKPDKMEHFLRLVRSTFAHVYFREIIMKEVHFMEDFLEVLEGIINAHIPPLCREIERFICAEVMIRSGIACPGPWIGVEFKIQDASDSEFTKRMVLLAERFNLEVLKMVAMGVLVEKIVGHTNPPAEFVNVSHDLKQYACEMKEITSEEAVVGSVVENMQSLARRVRRVSMSHSPSMSSQGSSPSTTPHDTGALSPAVSLEGRGPFSDAGHSRFKRVELA